MAYEWIVMAVSLLVLLVAVGSAVTAISKLRAKSRRVLQMERELEELKEAARREAETIRRETRVEAREETHRLRQEILAENKERRQELQRIERRLAQKEESCERRAEALDAREKKLAGRENEQKRREQDLETLLEKQRAELERIGGLSAEEARRLLLQRVEAENRQESARIIKQIEEETREKAEQEARKIITLAIQRCAVDQVSESTVSVVPLPGDDMKGRIIGREGRNIRTFENLTGVDLIIDDTPEAVVISGFDGVRREVARIALTNLVSDGRIHPRRIEETVERAREEVESSIIEASEAVALQTSVTRLHPELLHLLGKLKYRTSYGQNVLDHLAECAHLAGVMAAELGANIEMAKRGALLHDIGKALDADVDGGHPRLGAEIASQYGESKEVVNCIAAHHGDEEFQSLEAVLVQAADAISAARPGARRETLEHYLRRVESLEKLADSCEGVEKAYAIQAGRELRIIVKPERVDDAGSTLMAKEIARRIEQEGLQYPGQIKVTVIRETRAVEYTK
jgi:ribonuclease Y